MTGTIASLIPGALTVTTVTDNVSALIGAGLVMGLIAIGLGFKYGARTIHFLQGL